MAGHVEVDVEAAVGDGEFVGDEEVVGDGDVGSERATTARLPEVASFWSPEGCLAVGSLVGLAVDVSEVATSVVVGGVASVRTAGLTAVVEGADGAMADDVCALAGALLLRGVLTAFAYSARVTVARLACSGAGAATEGSLDGARGDTDFPWMTGLVTVIWTCDSAVLTPTRATAAVPMAAIDTATVSQPMASPAT